MTFRDEKELFDAVRRHIAPDLVETSPNFSFDAYSEEMNLYLEFKCRNRHYDKLIVEENKWFNMLRDMDKHEVKGFYINATPKGVFSFDIKDIHTHHRPKFVDKRLSKTTFYGGGRVNKRVAYLDISMARDIEASLIGL
jgi:hypothetical protein